MIKITPPLFFLYSAATDADAALNRNSKVAFVSAEIEHQTKTETELFAS